MSNVKMQVTLTLPYPEKVAPGDLLQVEFETQWLQDGKPTGMSSKGTATINWIRDGDGDLIPNMNPLVGDLVGQASVGTTLGAMLAPFGIGVGGKGDGS